MATKYVRKTVLKRPCVQAAQERGSSKLLTRPAYCVKYVRAANPTKSIQLKCRSWGRGIGDFLSASEDVVMERLSEDGFLPSWSTSSCPYCAQNSLVQLTTRLRADTPRCRCRNRACRSRVYPLAFHPIFKGGRNHAPIAQQAACLYLAVVGVQQNHAQTMLKVSECFVRDIYHSLRELLQKDVECEEAKITFGVRDEWPDVEVDEVTMAKRADETIDGNVVWDQFWAWRKGARRRLWSSSLSRNEAP